jgi:hypothetical protein
MVRAGCAGALTRKAAASPADEWNGCDGPACQLIDALSTHSVLLEAERVRA